MLNRLLPYVCSIKRQTITNTDGEDIRTYTTIYSNIKCRVYRGLYGDKGVIQFSDLGSETLLGGRKVILEPDKTNIRIRDVMVYEGEDYIVKDFRDMKLFTRINHIALICQKIT